MQVVSWRVFIIILSGVGAECEKRCVKGAGATHDDEEDVYLSAGPMSANGVGEGVFISNDLLSVRALNEGVGKIAVGVVVPFP
jgi:hypothetical protein